MIDTTEWFDDRLRNHFVIVLTNPPFLAGNVGPGHDSLKYGSHALSIDIWVDGVFMNWRGPLTFQFQLRASIVHEVHWKVGHGGFAMFDNECAAVGECTNGCRFNLMEFGQCFKRLHIVLSYTDRHALLAFRDQDFPRREAGLLEWDHSEIKFSSTCKFGHLSDTARQPACTVVCDDLDEARISRFQYHVKHFLLSNGVPDLDCATGAFFGQL